MLNFKQWMEAAYFGGFGGTGLPTGERMPHTTEPKFPSLDFKGINPSVYNNAISRMETQLPRMPSNPQSPISSDAAFNHVGQVLNWLKSYASYTAEKQFLQR